MNDFNPFAELSDEALDEAKKRIWNKMDSKLPARGLSEYQSVLSYFKESNAFLEQSHLKRVQVKERLLDMLPEQSPQPVFFLGKRASAFATLSVFFSFLFAPLFSPHSLVHASVQNQLQVVQGEVFVNGVRIEDRAVVKAGDRIVTSAQGLVHIAFSDDSRVTMGPDTDLQVLEVDERTGAYVHLAQFGGRTWSQVMSLASGATSFTLQLPQGDVLVDQRASFDVQVHTDRSEVAVLSNAVVLDQGLRETPMTQGESVVAYEALNEMGELHMDSWMRFNQDYGKTYSQQVAARYHEQAVEEAGILPGSPLYTVKTVGEGLKGILSPSQKGQEAAKLETVISRLNEASVLLEQGRIEQGQALLEKSEKTINEHFKDSNDPKLLATLDTLEKRVLVQPQPVDGLGILESHLSRVRASVDSKLEEGEAKLALSFKKLELVSELSEENPEQALGLLQSYEQEFVIALEALDALPKEEKREALNKLLVRYKGSLSLLKLSQDLPQLKEKFDVNAQTYEMMSRVLLSLREEQLSEKEDFFSATEGDEEKVYSHLKASSGALLDDALAADLAEFEAALKGSEMPVQVQPILVDGTEWIEGVEGSVDEQELLKEDPRFIDLDDALGAQEAKDEAEGGN